MNAPRHLGPFHAHLVPPASTTRRWPLTLFGPSGQNLLGGEAKIILPGSTEPVPFTRELITGLSLDCVRDPRNPDGTRLGRLEYGCEPKADGTPSNYDSWIFHELGGTASVPWTVIDDRLYVGLLRQRRNTEVDDEFNPSGWILNIPRGFLDSIQDKARAAARKELYEEVGVFHGAPVDLGGQNVTANNAWFGYDKMVVDDDGRVTYQGGVRFFGAHVKSDTLEEGPQSALRDLLAAVEGDVALAIIRRSNFKVLGFKPGALVPGAKDGPYEKIKNGLVFIPATLATDLRDGFTSVGVGRLRSWLEAKGAAKVTYDLSMLGE